MVKVRLKLFGLFLLCFCFAWLVFLAMLWQTLFGNPKRAYGVAVAYDICGNYALGGTSGKTVSQQVGQRLVDKKAWAIPVAWVIDLLMGKDHCINSVTQNELSQEG